VHSLAGSKKLKDRKQTPSGAALAESAQPGGVKKVQKQVRDPKTRWKKLVAQPGGVKMG